LKAFQFSLDRVLEWYAAQLLVEESQLRRFTLQLTDLERAAESLEHSRATAGDEIRQSAFVEGRDLTALDAYRVQIGKQKEALRQRLVEARKQVAAQRERLLAARRKHRLVEKLRERRVAEWVMESNREIEQNAAESHLARLSREK
jgi:flagellar export protein FliJ